jgi:CTP synthase (UTP-ammonia lyase)
LSTPVRIAIIGDFNPDTVSHATNAPAIEHAAASLGVSVEAAWVGTDTIPPESPGSALADFDGFWIAAGSPYKSRAGALAAIRFARESKRPTLATCGGFQYALLEFAHNVLGRTDLEHEEDAPDAEKHLIHAVSCPVPDRPEDAPKLSGPTQRVHIREDSRARGILETDQIHEEYFCNFELNPDYDELFEEHGLEFTGFGDRGDSRIFEVPAHPFYIGTLFQPQRRSRPEKPHPLVVALVEAASRKPARRGEPAVR